NGLRKGLTSTELLALRIRQLEKRPEDLQHAVATIAQSCFRSAHDFEKRFGRWISRQEFNPGELVLKRNTQVEKSMDRKHHPRYLGPYEVIRRTKGGSYILKELDSTTMQRGVARFRLLPYLSREEAAAYPSTPDISNQESNPHLDREVTNSEETLSEAGNESD
ncbi:hypothetical protein JAAARDRAFT_133761, partial [Jaapia argillacea MUCL 33604]